MTGKKDFNFPAFFKLEDELLKEGFIVLNPARNPKGLTYEDYMDISLAMVRVCDMVFTLDGFEDSPGAKAEVAYAASIGRDIRKGL